MKQVVALVAAGAVCMLSVTPASAQAPSRDDEGAVQATTHVAAAAAPGSIPVSAGSPEAAVEYWRYYAAAD